MKSMKILWLGLLLFITGPVWGYGSGSTSKACDKPGFSQFSPPEKADVRPSAEFSFMASPNTKPDTIKVAVKNLSASISIKPVAQGYLVSGTLPETLRGTFARINISAESANQCKGSGGWLLNIGE